MTQKHTPLTPAERIEELEILIAEWREDNKYLTYHDISLKDQMRMSDYQDELRELREAAHV